MEPLESYLKPIVDAVSELGRVPYLVLAASELAVGSSGLRAVLINRRTEAAPPSYNGISLEAQVFEINWGSYHYKEVAMSDKRGTRGNVQEGVTGFWVTLPREEGERKGRQLLVAHGLSPTLAQLMRRQRVLDTVAALEAD
jgi:hypothetical protein